MVYSLWFLVTLAHGLEAAIPGNWVVSAPVVMKNRIGEALWRESALLTVDRKQRDGGDQGQDNPPNTPAVPPSSNGSCLPTAVTYN